MKVDIVVCKSCSWIGFVKETEELCPVCFSCGDLQWLDQKAKREDKECE